MRIRAGVEQFFACSTHNPATTLVSGLQVLMAASAAAIFSHMLSSTVRLLGVWVNSWGISRGRFYQKIIFVIWAGVFDKVWFVKAPQVPRLPGSPAWFRACRFQQRLAGLQKERDWLKRGLLHHKGLPVMFFVGLVAIFVRFQLSFQMVLVGNCQKSRHLIRVAIGCQQAAGRLPTALL